MAENTETKATAPKKPRAPRKPKAAPAVINPENEKALEKFEEEASKPQIEDNCVAEAPVGVVSDTIEEVTAEPGEAIYIPSVSIPGELTDLGGPAESTYCTAVAVEPEPEIELPEETEKAIEKAVEEAKPADVPAMDEEKMVGPVEIKKLNPNLPDNKSKWIVQVPVSKTNRHVLFKGSYTKAYQAARNYNASKGYTDGVKKIRSK